MRRHRLDPLALVFGLATLTATGAWIAWREDLVTSGDLLHAAPVTLIVVGIVGIVGIAASFLRRGPGGPCAGDTNPDTDTDTDTEGASR